ncbi:heterokaryon incompatibility protein-domain-containing protein [Cercophora newfieldiana]|uniref:Heterokaryon incompatibility protein-domain-containing protein n=1 Tax=Cercophora newfieldiana TaxID=92897 RepID=A0AA40CKU5_9PEZI|nr:heterokaryon incompatibility protein-domain-containing protein [Cercophora newfieldiana]
MCCTTLAGETLDDRAGTSLPTRILNLNPRQGHDFVAVVEPGELVGRYCALSHCWGTTGKEPFRTTKDNLHRVMSGISIVELPRTFQEAIALTRALRIEYLWIDSLCIVQDDKLDWEKESKTMGQIYEQAFLVIAAAGSFDSTQGLFNIPRYPDRSIRVPYYSPDSKDLGSFNLTICNNLDNNPTFGPLAKRAWATQEWHLARRLVLFMPGGITFTCKVDSTDEMQGFADVRLEFCLIDDPTSTSQWFELLEQYSRRQLTFNTDRIPAILGIASEMGKRRSDEFTNGVWKKDLGKQLIWLRTDYYPQDPDQPHEHDLPDLPSWNWAALGGGYKKFLFELLTFNEELLERSCELGVVRLDPTSCVINAAGFLCRGTLPPAQRPQWLEAFCPMIFSQESDLQLLPAEGYMWGVGQGFGGDEEPMSQPFFINVDASDKENAKCQGFAVFD